MNTSGLSFWSSLFSKRNTFSAILISFLLFIYPAIVKADWKDDANARIELIRKRNAQITVVDANGLPIPDVNVQIRQKKHLFAFGTCIASSPLNSNAAYRNFILNHFEWAVCENESKWTYNEPSQGSVSYTDADSIYSWCSSNGIKMRGHCIFWEQASSLPSWVTSLAYAPWPQTSDLYTACQNRLNSVVPHFQNKFLHWDVDNEQLSDSFFDELEVVSTDVNSRVWMYQRAHELDPNCKLFVNEYSGNSFGGYDSGPYVTLIDNLRSKGAPIHAIGLQAHLNADATFDPTNYYNNVLEPLAVENLPVWATEFDAPHSNATTSADNIENFMRICFSHSSVEGIMFWGFMQNQMWRSNAYLCDSNGNLTERGTRYESLMNEWTTEDSGITDPNGNADFRGFHGTYEIMLTRVGEPNTEIHTIELEPGTGDEEFVLNTGFAGGSPDTNAPTPNPMTWASAPALSGLYSITMTATTAADATPPVQYYFECTNDANRSSGWQESTTYEVTGLIPGTEYTFRVKARDYAYARNETGWSDEASATTAPAETEPPTPDPMTWATVPAATGATTITMTATTATDDNSPPVQYYFECTTDANKSSGWQLNTTYIATNLTPSTLYSFRVKARDSSYLHNETGWSSTESATTNPPDDDVTPPTPDPMTWNIIPTVTDSNSILMAASPADDTSGVEFYFDCLTEGGHDSGWQDSITYQDTNLSPNTEYTYRVKARDKSSNHNETGWSTSLSAKTDYKVLHRFTGAVTDGCEPWGSLLLSSSTLYGMTRRGGSSDNGTLFKINTDGTSFQILKSFAGGSGSGWRPMGSLIQSGSTLYGMTLGGGPAGDGIVFKINTDGSNFQIIHSFTGGSSDGAYPQGSLAMSGTTLYGFVTQGGSANCGIIFKVNTDGSSYQLLHSFAGGSSDGAYPFGTPLLVGSALYGATVRGGSSNNAGTLFKINTDGTGYQILHNFSGDYNGGYPYFDSLIYYNSMLYGMTRGGENGIIFKVNTDGSGFQLVYQFTGGVNDGSYPVSLSLAQFGSFFYGMTEGGGSCDSGTVFQIDVNGTGFKVLHSFAGVDGSFPLSCVTKAGHKLYGMTVEGGSSHNSGSIFEVSLPHSTCSEVIAGDWRLEADLSGDCYVNYKDLDIFADYWLNTSCGSSNNCNNADFAPVDGKVDFSDFSKFADQWLRCNNPQDTNCLTNW